MADKVTFKISAAAAPYVGADKPRQDRLKAAAGQVRLPSTDFVLLVFYLCHDQDPEVKRTAAATLRGLGVPFLSQLLSNRQLHPRILDALVQLHFNKPEISALLAAHPMLSEKSATFLAQKSPRVPVSPDSGGEGKAPVQGGDPSGRGDEEVSSQGAGESVEEGAGEASEAALAGEVAPVEEEAGEVTCDAAPLEEEAEETEVTEEFQSKYQMAQSMGVSEKIKAALTGDKEWRGILIKDSNKLVSGSVVKNPRMTESEVLSIAKSTVQNDEIMRVICANKEWIKNPLIRKALVENSKTPLPAALRFIPTLSEKDLSQLAKSKNVSSVIASQARRLLLSKKH